MHEINCGEGLIAAPCASACRQPMITPPTRLLFCKMSATICGGACNIDAAHLMLLACIRGWI